MDYLMRVLIEAREEYDKFDLFDEFEDYILDKKEDVMFFDAPWIERRAAIQLLHELELRARVECCIVI